MASTDVLQIALMVDAIRSAGAEPSELLIHPEDYRAIAVAEGSAPVEVRGVPLRLDPETPRGKVLAVA
jgi:hypothetical protein